MLGKPGKHVWPDLAFREHRRIRSPMLQEAFDGFRPVNWRHLMNEPRVLRVRHQVGGGQCLAGHHSLQVRPCPFETGKHIQQQSALANASAVHPQEHTGGTLSLGQPEPLTDPIRPFLAALKAVFDDPWSDGL